MSDSSLRKSKQKINKALNSCKMREKIKLQKRLDKHAIVS